LNILKLAKKRESFIVY